LLTHEQGKNPQVGSGTEPVSKEEGQGFKQTGELLLNPIWSRIILQKQALEKSCKQAPEQAWKQGQNFS